MVEVPQREIVYEEMREVCVQVGLAKLQIQQCITLAGLVLLIPVQIYRLLERYITVAVVIFRTGAGHREFVG
jgi:hypothetical protein